MEEKSLQDYDESLRELEEQRVILERVMEKMGQEWEESGAGIAWLGSLDLPCQGHNEESEDIAKEATCATTTASTTTTMTTPAAPTTTKTILEDFGRLPGSLPAPLVEHTEPAILESPAYVQSILNANETLLAQGVYSHPNATSTPTTPDEYPQTAVFGSIAKKLDVATTSGPVIVSASGLSQDLQHDT